MLDAQLVSAALDSREAWERTNPYLNKDDLTPQGGFWWGIIGEWYARDRACLSVDREAVFALATARITAPKAKDTILGFFRDLPAATSPSNAANVALELKRHNVGMELAAAIAVGDQQRQSRLVPLYAELRAATELRHGKRARYEQAASVSTLLDKVGTANRIPLYPSKLNQRVGGGALPGHHILLYGRPEVGKSTITLNLACGLAIAGGQRVLYVGNEDSINVLKTRGVARVCGLTVEELETKREEAVATYIERGGEEYLRFVQMFDGGVDDLREPIEEFGPTVLVLDQIRNVAGENSDGITQRMEEVGQNVRRLLLEYKMLGISVTQAGASATGKAFPGMEDIDSSKTGLPATVDLAIGIGMNPELESRRQRGLSLSKNKLSAAPDAHEGLIVDVDFARCTVR